MARQKGRTTAHQNGQDWPAAQTPQMWPLDRIKPYDKNPRTHPPEQIAKLAASMLSEGVTMPILVDEAGVIIAGHGRKLAAGENGFAKYPVVIARGWSEEQKRAARIKDNSLGLMSGWDVALIKTELTELKVAGYDIPLLGFPEMQLREWEILPSPGTPPEVEIPPLPKKPVTKRGDIWQLENHRILCGDCRDADDVKRLLEGAAINVAFTSPPYAEQRDYDASSGFRPIPPYQFARGEWKMRPRSVMHASANVPIPGGPGSGQTSWKSGQGGRGNNSVSGSFGARKKNRGFPSGEGSQGTNWQANGMPKGIPLEEIGEGMAYPGNRLPTFASTHEATGHAAAFPVGLPAFFARAYSDADDAIYDPFLGSGSTLIAAAQNDRIGYGMELSPAYVDVAVERWQRLTGKKATIIRAKGSPRRISKTADKAGTEAPPAPPER